VPLSSMSHELQPSRRDLSVSSLPDGSLPARQAQGEAQFPAATPAAQQPNPLAILSPTLTSTPLTAKDMFRIYIHKSFGPPAVILPAFGAGFQMLNPPNHYPREWKDGAGAFGRIYGYKEAERA